MSHKGIPNTRWTPQLLRLVRACAANGMTMQQTAERLCVKKTALATTASMHKISFRGNVKIILPPDRDLRP